MRITFDTKTLRDAVANAATVATGKTTGLPICTHLLIQSTETEIRLIATDLEMALSQIVHGDIHEHGNCTIPARRLLNILNHVDGTEFTWRADAPDDDTHTDICLTAENATFRLTGLPAAEFPQISPVGDDNITIDMPAQQVLGNMRNALTSAGGQFEGVFLALFSEHLEYVATNAMQLTCIAENTQMPDALQERDIFIPQRAAAMVLNTFKDAEQLTVQMDLENSLITLSDTAHRQATVRLGAIPIPNHRSLLDTAEKRGSVTVERQDMLACLKRIVCFTNPANSACVMQAAAGNGNQLHFSAVTPELGEAYETLETATEPTPIRLGLNARAFIKALRAAPTEKVVLTYSEELKPLLIKSETPYEHITLLMPIRLESR